MSRSGERGRRLGLRITIAVLGLVVLIGGLRWLSAAAGLGLFEFMQPTVDDVLDGRVAKVDQEKATQAVEAWLDGVSIPGAEEVARESFISCERGQNNPEVNDGYRLRCLAETRDVQGWRGSYSDLAAAVTSALSGQCPSFSLDDKEPGPGQFTPSSPVDCGNGITVGVFVVNMAQAPDPAISPLSPIPCTGLYRCPVGAAPDDILDRLDPFEWGVVANASKVYYEDQM